MKYLDLSCADPARNLACDEALLDYCETAPGGEEVLRVWMPTSYFVVLGYSNKISREAHAAACSSRTIPILRRFSGGGAVLQGPGCLNYTLVIQNERPGYVGDLASGYQRVLQRHQKIFETLTAKPVDIEGISDLAIAGRKFSGNAQHRKRRYSLFHGTFLLNFDLSLIEICLHIPSRQPLYRQGRSHKSFLRNLLIDSLEVREALRRAWDAKEELRDFPYERIEELLRKRYACSDWNSKY